MRLITLLLLSLCFGFSGTAQSPKEKIKVTDMLNVKQVTQLVTHPSGEMAVYVLNSIEADKDNKGEYKYLNQLVLLSLNAPYTHRVLTGKEGAAQPAFSPDGKQLVFVRPVDRNMEPAIRFGAPMASSCYFRLRCLLPTC